jgi:outer membrane protein W
VEVRRHLSPLQRPYATPFHHTTVSLNGPAVLWQLAVDIDSNTQWTSSTCLERWPSSTVTLQYYFLPDSAINPFVGAGLNYTWTYGEDEIGAATSGAEVGIGNSWGLAAQVGAVIKLGDKMDLVLDARWADIDADVQLSGAEIGTANVDPLVYGLTLGFRF